MCCPSFGIFNARGSVRGYVGVNTHTFAHARGTDGVLDASPGVGRTPGEPEESRSTKAQYTCRPYRCTQHICEIGRASDRDASGGRRREYRSNIRCECICLYIYWAAGFDDLG